MGKKQKIVCPEYDAVLQEVEAARARVKESGAKAARALLKQFFALHPAVTAVGWTQYTPHFNDGDPCVFGVHEPYLSTKTGVDFAEVGSLYDDDGDEGHGFKDSYSLEDKALKAALEALERSIDRDIFETAFGDHVMVIATPDGFHVSEYSHE